MCFICVSVKVHLAAQGFLDEAQTDSALTDIAQGMKNGMDQEHLERLLDKILGTGLTERDLEIEEAWEKAHRKNG